MTGLDERALREFADMVAMRDSGNTSALLPHRIITEQLWKALRTLGFDSGRVLVHGDDPATFLGQPHTKGYGFGSLTATVGPAHRPGDQIRADGFANFAEDFDLVIAALPFNDVKFAQPVHQVRRRAVQNALALASLDLTKPGGITVVLASHDLLDVPYSGARQEIASQADLIGAVRLPNGIQRNVAGTDVATDLLPFHRVVDGERPWGIEFTGVTAIVVEGRMFLLNTYFDERSDYVLGQIGVDPIASGPNALTVTADPGFFEVDLGTALDDIATTACRAGLVYSAGARTLDVAPQSPEQLAAGGASVSPARGREPEDRDSEPDWDDPNLGEPGLGLW